jgi:hypothetical protein
VGGLFARGGRGASRFQPEEMRSFLIRERMVPMKGTQPISVVLVAMVSAALHGAVAVVFVPILSFLLLSWGAAPVQLSNAVAGANNGMVFAVIAPLCCAVFGFFAGAFAAFTHNVFAKDQPRTAIVMREEEMLVPDASLAA